MGQNHLQRISVIIPAYNEDATIADVLQTVIDSKLADEIIVVNDGSNDSTREISEFKGVKVISLENNTGKGNAMYVGLGHSIGDIILFLDADLIGLQKVHINDLLKPVVNDEVKMAVGKFQSGAFWTTLSQHITPFLSGQRAIKREIFDEFKDMQDLGFGVETALTLYFRKNKLPFKEVSLYNLTHVVKEKKFGFLKGFLLRIKMYNQIIRSLYLK